MTDKEYRSNPAISRSSLWKVEDSPEKFRYNQDTPFEPTPALLFGQLFHKMALEPDSFFNEFAVYPQCDKRTKTGKEIIAEFQLSAIGKTFIFTDDYLKSQQMCQALKNHPLATQLLQGEREKTYFWTDKDTGEPCKSRVDTINNYNGIRTVVDLKTALHADMGHFQRDFFKYGYHLQVAMYSNGVQANENVLPQFYFVVIEKDPPYAINIVKCTDLIYSVGNDKYRELMGIYHDCKTTGNWYGYMGAYDLENELEVPNYMLAESGE